MQFANKLYQAYIDLIKLHQVVEHQTFCNLTFADLLQVDETACIKPVCSSQLATSLLTTWNRLVIIKPEQAMRTHPDIGVAIADLLQLARFWLCTMLHIIFNFLVATLSLLAMARDVGRLKVL